MTIRLTYGDEQRFRFRCPDITIRGQIENMTMPSLLRVSCSTAALVVLCM